MIHLLIFLLAAGFGDTCNPSNASLPIWLSTGTVRVPPENNLSGFLRCADEYYAENNSNGTARRRRGEFRMGASIYDVRTEGGGGLAQKKM